MQRLWGGLADPYQIGGIGPHHGSHIYFFLVLYAMIRDMEELLQWGGEEWLAIAGSIRIPSSSKRTESNSPDKHTLAWSMFYGLLSMICCSACCTSFLARTTTHYPSELVRRPGFPGKRHSENVACKRLLRSMSPRSTEYSVYSSRQHCTEYICIFDAIIDSELPPSLAFFQFMQPFAKGIRMSASPRPPFGVGID